MTVEHNTKKLPLRGVGAYRVVDLETFNRLHAAKTSYRRMARQLGIPLTNIRKLVLGQHWQQDAKKIALFNEFHGVTIDVETGIAPPSVLEQFGSRMNERRELAKANAPAIPEKPDTPWFLEQLDNALARILVRFDDEIIGQANLRELSYAASILTEKRNLLMDRPTEHITYEQHVQLDALLPKLIEEAKRRGIAVDGMAEDVTDQKALCWEPSSA